MQREKLTAELSASVGPFRRSKLYFQYPQSKPYGCGMVDQTRWLSSNPDANAVCCWCLPNLSVSLTSLGPMVSAMISAEGPQKESGIIARNISTPVDLCCCGSPCREACGRRETLGVVQGRTYSRGNSGVAGVIRSSSGSRAECGKGFVPPHERASDTQSSPKCGKVNRVSCPWLDGFPGEVLGGPSHSDPYLPVRGGTSSPQTFTYNALLVDAQNSNKTRGLNLQLSKIPLLCHQLLTIRQL